MFADTVVNDPQPVQLKNTAVRTSAGTNTSAPDTFVKVIVRVVAVVTKCTVAARLPLVKVGGVKSVARAGDAKEANVATAEKVTTTNRRTFTPSS